MKWWRSEGGECPGCEWGEYIRLAVLWRWGRVVGSVRKCARCGVDYCWAGGKVYRPRVVGAQVEKREVVAEERGKRRVVGDADMVGMF